MSEDTSATQTNQAPPLLRVMRPDRPATALGLAVNHMMTKPAFANRRFGEWARVLAGQINRNHYFFVVDAKNQIQGFVGWAITTKEKAEAWVEDRRPLGEHEANEGDCIVFNAWAANNRQVNRFLVEAARKIIVGKDTCYFKRFYNNGSVRPVRLRVNDFVAGHLSGAGDSPE
jgi:hemolysin-activating ACP:hemolysin acyltransferase